LNPKAKQEITVTYSPAEAQVVVASAVVKINDGEDGSSVIKMSAIGKYPFLMISNDSIDFEELLVGKSLTKEVTLRNSSLVQVDFKIEKLKDDN
jgi:hypothetical protein